MPVHAATPERVLIRAGFYTNVTMQRKRTDIDDRVRGLLLFFFKR